MVIEEAASAVKPTITEMEQAGVFRPTAFASL